MKVSYQLHAPVNLPTRNDVQGWAPEPVWTLLALDFSLRGSEKSLAPPRDQTPIIWPSSPQHFHYTNTAVLTAYEIL
jgi:hypothetical protein